MHVLTWNVDLGYMSVEHTERHKYDITYLSLPILALFVGYDPFRLILMISVILKWRLKCPRNFRSPPWILPTISVNTQ